MSSSLVLSTVGELLPSGPRAPGVHLLLAYDLGTPEAVRAQVEALLLDGARVLTTRAGNRTLTLPLVVIGSSRADMTARVDALLLAVAQLGFTLTWTPDGGLPIVWDCFAAQPQVQWDVRVEDAAWTQAVTLTIPALPFGRSPALETVTLTTEQTEGGGRRYSMSDLLGSARAPLALDLGWGSNITAWLAHRPPATADPDAPILTAVTAGVATVANAERLRGSYTIAVGVSTYNAPGEPRVMECVIDQGGTTQTIRRAYMSAANLVPLIVGNVTLPLVDRPAAASFSITFTLTDSGGTAGDTAPTVLMLLDTAGQTVQSRAVVDVYAAHSWLDEPVMPASVGRVWNSPDSALANALAAADPRMDGGPLVVSAADEGGALLVHGDVVPSSIAATYRPRWLAERVA